MLKDNIVNRFNIRKFDADLIDFNIRGELDVKGWRDGQLVYHDGGDNTITLWAKHAMIHALTGDIYSSLGNPGYNTPLANITAPAIFGGTANNHTTNSGANYYNRDGSMVSQYQYWWDYTTAYLGTSSASPGSCPPWSTPNTTLDTTYSSLLYSILPTKVLFGTGKEADTWAHAPLADQSGTGCISGTGGQGFTLDSNSSTGFDYNISNTGTNNNKYSGTLTNAGVYGSMSGTGTLTPSRTYNDPQGGKITGTPDPSEYGVQGAIKDSIPTQGSASAVQTLTQVNKGIGNPCFIYFQRNYTSRWTSSNSEVYLSLNSGDSYEHKITYSVTMPAQTGSYPNWYYPYNGYTLKVAGLFSDSQLAVSNTAPSGTSDPAYLPYNNMPNGLMFAKRYISPITKSYDLQLSIQWTLYL